MFEMKEFSLNAAIGLNCPDTHSSVTRTINSFNKKKVPLVSHCDFDNVEINALKPFMENISGTLVPSEDLYGICTIIIKNYEHMKQLVDTLSKSHVMAGSPDILKKLYILQTVPIPFELDTCELWECLTVIKKNLSLIIFILKNQRI